MVGERKRNVDDLHKVKIINQKSLQMRTRGLRETHVWNYILSFIPKNLSKPKGSLRI